MLTPKEFQYRKHPSIHRATAHSTKAKHTLAKKQKPKHQKKTKPSTPKILTDSTIFPDGRVNVVR